MKFENGQTYYLLSVKWLNAWKRYVDYAKVMKVEEEATSPAHDFMENEDDATVS